MFRPAIFQDIDDLLAIGLRAADHREIKENGSSITSSLMHGVIWGYTYTLFTPSGVPMAMCGATGSRVATNLQVWLLGTDDIQRYPISFLGDIRHLLSCPLARSKTLDAAVVKYNTLHNRFIQRLGFEKAGEDERYTFYIRRPTIDV